MVVPGALLGIGLSWLAVTWITLPRASAYAQAWPDTTAYMRLRVAQAERRGKSLTLRYQPVPLSAVPASLRRAVLVSEDAAFYDHEGFDWYELRAALQKAWQEREPLRGASTITQQLARNLWLSPRRTLGRKVREALATRRLERQLPKNRILELYLSVIELGPGIFGVEAASRHYFGAPVSDLSHRQAAMLAATIPAPLRDNPGTATRRFRWRTDLVEARAFGDEASAREEGPSGDERPRGDAFPDDSAEPGGHEESGEGAGQDEPASDDSIPASEATRDDSIPASEAAREDSIPASEDDRQQ